MSTAALPPPLAPAPPPPPLSVRQWLVRGAGTALVAGMLLTCFVLPAEWGIDPTGAGKAMGLTALSAAGEPSELDRGAARGGHVLSLSDAPVKQDHWTFELRPFSSIEFKYEMAQGSTMLFDWHATGELYYYMHAHPFAGGTALTEAYAEGDGTRQQGSYTAPFTGIHGWYWQNRSPDNVTLTLDATGAVKDSILFDEYGEHHRAISETR